MTRDLKKFVPQPVKEPMKDALEGFARARAVAAGQAFARAWRTAEAEPAAVGTATAARTHDSNPLEEFFEARREGRGIYKWRHYFGLYHRHMAKFVGAAPRILEVGVYSGGSLEMWREYLGEGTRVYGVDIEPGCKQYEDDSVQIFIGDQSDRSFWRRFRRETPELDIVVDDGGHAPEQQIVTLEELLPHLRPGGVYICEDIHGDANPFLGYVYGLSRALCAADLREDVANPQHLVSSRPTPFQTAVHSVHWYPYMVVIERRADAVDEFVAAKHGTHWKPLYDRSPAT